MRDRQGLDPVKGVEGQPQAKPAPGGSAEGTAVLRLPAQPRSFCGHSPGSPSRCAAPGNELLLPGLPMSSTQKASLLPGPWPSVITGRL